MYDIELGNDFDVRFTDENDIGVVSGADAFEQAIVVRVTDYMQNQITGVTGSEGAVEEKIKLQVTRVARDEGVIESVESVSVEQNPDSPDTYNVTVDYGVNESFYEEFQR